MTEGRRWLAVDADMFSKRFINDLHERFGPAGVAVWVAFLCACKMSPQQGKVRMASDHDGMYKLGLSGWDLIDNKGEPWTLTEFFEFTGRKKQTRRVAVQLSDSRRIAAQRLLDVCATHWEHWQDACRTDVERLRKRRWAQQNRRRVDVASASRARREIDADIDSDIDSDISPLPPSAPASPDTTSSGRRGNGTGTPKNPEDPLVARIRACVPGTGTVAARLTIERLRAAGIGDVVIDEAAGYAAEHGAGSARYVEQVAHDWMTQRDPTWQPPP